LAISFSGGGHLATAGEGAEEPAVRGADGPLTEDETVPRTVFIAKKLEQELLG
jgi:hypothetical protein